jgi:hypothetical protein
MVRGQIQFTEGLLRLPIRIQLWLLLLGGINLVVPLFFLDRLEARLTLGAFLVAMTLMALLTQRWGFTRILGLGHVVWFALLPFLWTRLDTDLPNDLFGIWIRAVLILNAISLAFDVADVVRYARGDRAKLVAGL